MKKVKLFEQYIAEKKTKEDYEDIIDDLESKIWEIENTKAYWIPDSPAKKDKMIQTYQKRIDAAKKALSKLDEQYIAEKKTKEDYEDIIDDLESKIWEIENTKAYWIPDSPAKKDKMIQTYQKRIDAAKKALSKLDRVSY